MGIIAEQVRQALLNARRRVAMQGFDGEDESPLVPGTIRGYRWWHLRISNYPADSYTMHTRKGADGRLYPEYASPFTVSAGLIGMYGNAWENGREWHEARCAHLHPGIGDTASYVFVRRHAVPDSGCSCGFWAYWQPEDHSCSPIVSSYSSIDIPVLGVVEGAGRALIGTRGFRAQKARILAVTPMCDAVFRPRPCPGTLSDGLFYPAQDRFMRFMPADREAVDGAILLSSFGRVLNVREDTVEVLAVRLQEIILGALRGSLHGSVRVLQGRSALKAEFPLDETYAKDHHDH